MSTNQERSSKRLEKIQQKVPALYLGKKKKKNTLASVDLSCREADMYTVKEIWYTWLHAEKCETCPRHVDSDICRIRDICHIPPPRSVHES